MRYHVVRRAPEQQASTAPPWVDSMTIGTWYTIAGTSGLDLGLSATNIPDNVDPDPTNSQGYRGGNGVGFRAMMDKWGGGMYAPTLGQYGSIIISNGGHQDYWGNGILRLDLFTRAWSMLVLPSTSGPFTSGASCPNGLLADGRPAQPHTYNNVHWHPSTNSFVRIRSVDNIGAPDAGGEANVARPHMLDLVQALAGTVNWRRGPGPSTGTLQSVSSGSSCYDSIRDCFWLLQFANGRFGKYSNITTDNGDGTLGSWSVLNSGQVYGFDQSMEHDPVSDRVVVFDGNLGTVYRKDPNNMAGARSAVTMSGSLSMDTQSSLHYCSALGGFTYHKSATSSVYVVTSSDGYVNATSTLATLNANGKSFSVDNGFYSKSVTAAWGTKVVQMICCRTNQPTLAMRLQ